MRFYPMTISTVDARPYLRAFREVVTLMMVYDHSPDHDAAFVEKGLKYRRATTTSLVDIYYSHFAWRTVQIAAVTNGDC